MVYPYANKPPCYTKSGESIYLALRIRYAWEYDFWGERVFSQ